MTVSMQGTWIVEVTGKESSWSQQVKVSGTTNGADATYPGTVGTTFVGAGPQWGITVEHNPTGPLSWTMSRHRLSNFRLDGAFFKFEILSDDSHPHEDFDDLVVTCSMPLSASDWVVYGRARSYSGNCPFNPCFPIYVVIENYWQLDQILAWEPGRRLLEKLYPERVKQRLKRPFPEPDPPPFKPMMVPTGERGPRGYQISGRTLFKETPAKKGAKKGRTLIEETDAAEIEMVADWAYTSLADEDLMVAARFKDLLKLVPCEVKNIPESVLRFVEYDRTSAEKAGGSHTGDGFREVLGMTTTDELGNYIYRFSRSAADFAAETTDVTATEDLITGLNPDLIIQLLAGLPDVVACETAPYYNIPNVKRIDLCFQESCVGRPPAACQGGRAIQKVGDIVVVPISGTTLHADGTISNSSPSGPAVEHAAWRGNLHLHACFLDFRDTNDAPRIKYYTVRYRRRLQAADGTYYWESDWHFVNEPYEHPHKQSDGTIEWDLVGPHPGSAEIDGTLQPINELYMNIEEDEAWQLADRDRKVYLKTGRYQSVAGRVMFKIEGYDASGNKVAGAEDTVTLYLDNHRAEGDIDYVKYGTEDPGECALFDLPADDTALDVRYRVTDPEGYLRVYSLKAYRGSNFHVALENSATGSPVRVPYDDVLPYKHHGTLDETVDPTGYVEVAVQPAGGSWLPAERDFCCFTFELHAADRTTDGHHVPSVRILWREHIGIQRAAAGGASGS